MEKVKMSRLSEMNSSKNPFQKAKPETVKEKPKEDPAKEERERELKQIRTQITKSEKEIEVLENEIKIFDEQLSDPEKYQSVINDKAAFADYEKKKKRLELEMANWETLQNKL
jgi:predicted RNase H-like nuclease (RuvC/YqgF family)